MLLLEVYFYIGSVVVYAFSIIESWSKLLASHLSILTN